MKKQYWSFLFIFLSIYTCISQCNGNDCLSKGAMAVFTYDQLYGANDPDEYPSFNYPDPFIDLYGNPFFDNKIKVLSYLDYDDGITVFASQPGGGEYFLVSGGVTRYDAVAFLLEAWNIKPDYTGSVPYSDINSNDSYFGYINEANDLNLLNGVFGSNFNGQYGISTFEFTQILNNILSDSNLHPISQNELNNEDNYYLPNNYQRETLGFLRGMEQGVFSHYAKNSFVIPDRKMNLNFSHSYSTQLVELPQNYFPIQPLGRGWTHTYNAYITSAYNAEERDTFFYIKWPDGSIHIYNNDKQEYISKGVYNDFELVNNGDDIKITTKQQITYYFDRLDNSLEIFYLERIEDRNGNQINIDYERSDIDDDLRRIASVESPTGKKLEFRYQNDTDLIERIIDPINRKIEFEYSGLSGNWVYKYPILVSFDDAKGQNTTYAYGNNNALDIHLLNRIRLPENNIIKAEYDNDNNGKLERYFVNDQEYEIDLKINYNDEDTPVTSTVKVPLPNGSTENQDYKYNANGLVTEYEDSSNDIKIDYPQAGNKVLLPNNTDINGLDIDYEYDDSGNVVEINVENGSIVKHYTYNNDNTINDYEDPNGNRTFFSYDANGNVTTITDPLGNQITNSYDGFGQMESTTNQEGITIDYEYEDGMVTEINAPENLSSSFTYDNINRMTSKTINGQTSSYTYDNNNNITSYLNIGGHTTTYDYDKNDNLITITNANNIDTKFEYDNQDRVKSEDFNSLKKEYLYNNDNSLKEYRKTGGDKIEYEYDNEGRLEETGTITDHDYNRRNLLSSMANNDSRLIFEYNDINRVIEVTNSYSNSTVAYKYDDVGNVTQITYPDGLKVTYDYDKKNRLISIKANSGNGNEDIATYTYYDDDRLRKITNGNGLETLHFYDDAGRLHSKILANSSNQEEYFVQKLEFDNTNNISSQNIKYNTIEQSNDQEPNFETTSYSYNDNNHIEGDHAVNNDGNLTSDGLYSHSYDLDDRLTQRQNGAKNITYKYNPYGHLISRTENDVEEIFIWDILSENIIVSQKNGVTNNHIYGLGLEASIDQNGNLQFYHGDHRGNVLMVSNENRDITKVYSYDDFGKTSILNSTSEDNMNLFTFMGKYGILNEDIENGLYYVRARYYDSTTGRFLTQDPIWSTNLYPYANNKPISNVDFNGENFVDFHLTLTGNFLYNFLGLRPDGDGFVNILEGHLWAASNNGKPVVVDGSKLNFGNTCIEDAKDGEVNLFNFKNLSPSSWSTTYALGAVKVEIIDEKNGLIKVKNGNSTTYDWNWKNDKYFQLNIRDLFIAIVRIGSGISDESFDVYVYGNSSVRTNCNH